MEPVLPLETSALTGSSTKRSAQWAIQATAGRQPSIGSRTRSSRLSSQPRIARRVQVVPNAHVQLHRVGRSRFGHKRNMWRCWKDGSASKGGNLKLSTQNAPGSKEQSRKAYVPVRCGAPDIWAKRKHISNT